MQRSGRFPRDMRRTSGNSGAFALLGAETDGVALDFTDLTAFVRDTTTPANTFSGNVNDWFTYTSPSTKWIRNSAGLLESGSTLRTEYDAALLPLGARIEPAATNLALRSQEFDNGSAWVVQRTLAFGSGSIANAIAAPDGTMTADKVVENSDVGVTHNMYSAAITISAGAVATYSKFVKAGERSGCRLEITSGGGVNGGWARFDLAAGTVASSGSLGTGAYISSSIESWLNGWYRCSVTATVDPAATAVVAMIRLADGGGNITYTGDGASGLYVWGAQVEVGRWASSYIPTTTTTVTRAADNVTKLITSMPFSATAGTLFAEFSTASPELAGGVTYWGATLNDATANNYVGFARLNDDMYFNVNSGGVNYTNLGRLNIITSAYEMHRTAIAWAANDAMGCADGTLTSADTSVTVPVGVTRLEFARQGANQTGGHMMRGLYVPRRMSNDELQAVTT